MIWTFILLLCVVATKFVTAVRLRGLKARLESVRPEIEDLRAQVAQAEDQTQELSLQVTKRTELLTALQDAVRSLEDSIKQGPSETDRETAERVALIKTLENEHEGETVVR